MTHKKTPASNVQPVQPEITDAVILRFLQILEDVRKEDLSCGDMYERLDEFVEAEIKEGKDAKVLTPLIREHLNMCSDCCDEYEALLDVIEHADDEADSKGTN
ncbi:MAG: hypothetical protein LC099_00605 [Anaerolineales bacterium]|nr:hypothetical protein [Anaerolineales bacterium]